MFIEISSSANRRSFTYMGHSSVGLHDRQTPLQPIERGLQVFLGRQEALSLSLTYDVGRIE
jgi:hypothetical protein